MNKASRTASPFSRRNETRRAAFTTSKERTSYVSGNGEFKWTEDWRLMLHLKALAAGKRLPKAPRITPIKHLPTCTCPTCKKKANNPNNDKSK